MKWMYSVSIIDTYCSFSSEIKKEEHPCQLITERNKLVLQMMASATGGTLMDASGERKEEIEELRPIKGRMERSHHPTTGLRRQQNGVKVNDERVDQSIISSSKGLMEEKEDKKLWTHRSKRDSCSSSYEHNHRYQEFQICVVKFLTLHPSPLQA